MEDLRNKLDLLLLKADLSKLKEVAVILSLDTEETTSKRGLMRGLQKSMDMCEDNNMLLAIKTTMEQQEEESMLQFEGEKEINEEIAENKKKERESKVTGNFVDELLGAVGSERSAFHKDFKIRGQIGESGQKDKLSYISLLKQIDEGKEKGFDDREIVSAVLRAITPGLYLRNVLETTDNLTLKRLMRFLQSHYVEKNTTDLYQALNSLTQSPQETATQFVYRAMSLRQKLILASKCPGAEIPFDKNLIRKLFFKAVETGITNDNIIAEIKPIIKEGSVSDEDLIFAVGQASSVDSQRNNKIKKTKTKGCINNLTSEVLSEITPDNQDKDVLKVLKEMQNELASLKTEVRALKKEKSSKDYREESSNNYYVNRSKKCESCEKFGYQECRHCFKCGGIGHAIRNCPSKRSENAQRLMK